MSRIDKVRGGHWNPLFSKNLNDWETKRVEAIFLRLQNKVVRRNEKDKME